MRKTKLSFLSSFIPAIFILSGCSDVSNDDIAEATPKAKNVILMVTDGASDGAWDISSYWSHGESLNAIEPYNQFSHLYAMTTYPFSTRSSPAECVENPVSDIGYDPDRAWDDTPSDHPRRVFAGYEYLNENYTDSAAAGTALATGHKTYKKAISVNYCGQPLKLITEYAKEQGMSTGVVTSVQFSHATPAVFGAKHLSRSNAEEIASQMLSSGYLDLIMGAGHPMFNDDGVQRDNFSSSYIFEEDFNAVQNGTLSPDGSDKPWAFIDQKNMFEALANDTIAYEFLDAPLFALAPVGSTLQQGRSCQEQEDRNTPFACTLLETSPTLEVMTQGALNYLSQKGDGFFLMVEGGAVDWAAHANDTTRITEEQIDFNDSVTAVMDWVDQYSSWDETLIIVTTDHGNSYVLGEQSDTVAYEKVVNDGKYHMPEVKYYSGDHTNELVRVYSKGIGVDKFANYVSGVDDRYVEKYNNFGSTGEYFDNTNIFDVMKEVITQ